MRTGRAAEGLVVRRSLQDVAYRLSTTTRWLFRRDLVLTSTRLPANRPTVTGTQSDLALHPGPRRRIVGASGATERAEGHGHSTPRHCRGEAQAEEHRGLELSQGEVSRG